MKPETEKLLQQCRTVLLHYSNEQLNTLFVSWLERMMGEESMDEELDDLCLLLGYGIRSSDSHILYATYTAWWEVEGYDGVEGEFECLNVAALQHYLITMPIKQFHLVTELAYQVCVSDAEMEQQSRPSTGQAGLRALAVWLNTGAQEPFYIQNQREEPLTTLPLEHHLTRKQRRAQQRKTEDALIEQAWQRGYLLVELDMSDHLLNLVQNRCKKNRRPYITAQNIGAQFAAMRIELRPVRRALETEGKLFPGAPEPTFRLTDEIRQRMMLSSSREIKANLVQHLLTHLETDKTAKAQFFEVFAVELAVPPWELETLLGCTTTERKRWTEETKLPVIGYGHFRKAGSDHAYALYDRRVILTLTSNKIEVWRNEHKALVRERRRTAARIAVATKKAKLQEAQIVYKG